MTEKMEVTARSSLPIRPTRITFSAWAIFAWCGLLATAQEPSPLPLGGFPAPLPQVRERPAQAPSVISSFIDSVGSNDATFEVKVHQGRLLTLKENLANPGQPSPVIAVGDPSVIDFVPVGPRQIRVIGRRIGTTDLSFTASNGRTFSFEVQVVADLDVLRAKLRQLFPDALLKVTMIRDHLVVEGQARSPVQTERILETIRAYLVSLQNSQAGSQSGQAARTPGLGNSGQGASNPGDQPPPPPVPGAPAPNQVTPGGEVIPDIQGGSSSVTATITTPQLINLIRVPTSQQVLLKVRIAELNRTGFRQIGADFLANIPEFGALLGTQIGGASVSATGSASSSILAGTASNAINASSTAFGIFQKARFDFILTALRRNNLLKILAEPNLVSMSGHQASFLAGGEFPIPIPQVSNGVSNSITVQFKEFGVRLAFVPYVLDGDTIHLTVDPEVSTIDRTLGVTLTTGGSPIPGLNTRRSHATVEMHQGQTLAIAGLMQLTLDGQTTRIPGLGDLPYIGPFFSNTTGTRTEKELIVLVTPYLVEPMNPDQVPPGPGDEVKQPNDLEFFFLNRIEGRTGTDARATTNYDDPFHVIRHSLLERKYFIGPSGYAK